MKTKSPSSNAKFLACAAIGFVLLLLACYPQSAIAQTNTFPSSGNVGVGTTTPSYPLEVNSNQNGVVNLVVLNNPSSGANAQASFGFFEGAILKAKIGVNSSSVSNPYYGGTNAFQFFNMQNAPIVFGTNGAERVRIDGAGNVGIGTTTPGRPLVVTADASGIPLRVYRNVNNVGWGTGINWAFNNSAGSVTDYAYVNSAIVSNTAGSENGTLGFFTVKSGTLTQQAIIDQNGNVGIGTANPQYKLDVAGNINSSATITGNNIVAKYQDVAEWVPASEQLAAGTVVVLDSTKSNQVMSSTQSYDTRVAGVISEQPGISLGESGKGKVLVATTGRVRVKVDASRGPIHVGDLLVTSDVPGVAMKSEPVNLGGVQLHRPGTLIGKALEPLEKGSETILVLLSLQ